MYESYWQLETKPFENTADIRFYYPSDSHQGAMLKLRYAVESQRGAALLAGASGLGKTLIVQALTRQLSEQFSPIVHLVFPQMPPSDILAYLAGELTGELFETPPTIQQSVQRIEHFLAHNVQARRHAVIVVDEAHLLDSPSSLETIRLLLNFQQAAHSMLTVLLVGQPPLLPVLDRTPELDERLGVKCLLRRYAVDETVAYISHRMNTAGAKRQIFEDEALETIHQLSHGIPRQINRLSDLALLVGFAEERQTIAAAQIESIADELVAVTPE